MTRTNAQAGFTLLELLVSMTLLALLTIVMFGSLRFGARAWDRSEAHGAGMEQVRLVQELLRRDLEQAYPAFLDDPSDPHIDFRGDDGTMRLLGPSPQSAQLAGRARLLLERAKDGPYVKLVMRAQPELSTNEAAAWQETLLGGLTSLRFSYFGADGWHDSWSDEKFLPLLIRIRAGFPPGDARQWPELIVQPHILVDANCVYDSSTQQCRGR